MAFNIGALFGTLQITGTTEAVAGLVRVQDSLAVTGDSATQASAMIDRTSIALEGAGRATAVAAGGSAKLRAAQLSAIAATERYNTVLGQEDASLGRLASTEASVIRANERVAVAQQQAAAGAKDMAVAQGEAGVASVGMAERLAPSLAMLGKLGIAFGAFELVKKAIDITKQAAEFQRAMSMIETNANASAAEVKNMSAAVLTLSPQVATGPNDLALSLYHVEQNGLRGKQALDVLTVAAEGAKVGNADLEATTNSMTSAVKSGIPGVENLSQAMGALIAIVGTGDMKMSDLNEALGSGLLSTTKNYGLSLKDVGSALAVFGDLNIRGADAATQLRMAVMNLAKPAKGGAEALGEVHLSLTQLGEDMQKGGLLPAIDDLVAHLNAAGITGNKVGQWLTTAFGKRAGVGLGILVDQVALLHVKMDELNQGSVAGAFEKKWTETTQTASFAFHKLGAEVETFGITLANKALPAVNTAGHWLGTELPHDLGVLQATLLPLEHEVGVVLVGAWTGVVTILKVAGTVLGDVGHFLAEHKTAVKDVGTFVLGMWAAWKGYQIVTFAVGVMKTAWTAIQVKALEARDSIAAYGSGVQATFAGNATAAQIQATQLEAASLRAQATAREQAAAVAQAAWVQKTAYAETMAAAGTASDEEILAANLAATAAEEQAVKSQAAAVQIRLAATEAAAASTAAGEEAALGWGAMLGPVGLVVGGLAALGLGFMGSGNSAKAASQQVDSFTASIQADSGAIGENTRLVAYNALVKSGAIDAAKQLGLSLDDVTSAALGQPDAIARVNAAYGAFQTTANGVIVTSRTGTGVQQELAKAALAGGGAISQQQTAWDKLHPSIASTNTTVDAAIQKAKDQTAAMGGSTAAAVTAAKGTAAYAVALKAADDASKAMTDTTANLNDTMTIAATDSNTAIDAMATAVTAFEKAGDTAASRAALIGATLKNANGDALDYAAAMTGAASANQAMVDAFTSQASTLAQQAASAATASANQSTAATNASTKQAIAKSNAEAGMTASSARLTAAEARLQQVRGTGKSTTAQITAAEASLASAQASTVRSSNALSTASTTLAKAASSSAGATTLAFKDTELAAINLTTGVIDFNAKGAAPLVSQLQAIQDGAMKAAEATYQHELATKGGAKAADDAYAIYKTETQQFVDQATQLGLTTTQAQKLANQYFGMPANVKTMIEAEGTDPIVQVLDKIGKMLADLTGQPWVSTVSADTTPATVPLSAFQEDLHALHDIKLKIGVDTAEAVAQVKALANTIAALPGPMQAKVGHRSDPTAPGMAVGGAVNGSGPIGVDSQARTLAPGEWVINDKAVAALKAKYGPSAMPTLNSGRLPAMANQTAPKTTTATGMSAGKTVHIDKVEMNVHYPLPDEQGLGITLPHLLRSAATAWT